MGFWKYILGFTSLALVGTLAGLTIAAATDVEPNIVEVGRVDFYVEEDGGSWDRCWMPEYKFSQ